MSYLVHGEVAPVGHGEGGAGDVLHTLLQATRIGEREEGGWQRKGPRGDSAGEGKFECKHATMKAQIQGF